MVTKRAVTVTETANEIILVELRRLNISHSSAARELGIGRDTFARRLDGPNGFTGAETERLAELIGTTPSQLFARAERQRDSRDEVSA